MNKKLLVALAYLVVGGCTASGSVGCKKTDYHKESEVRDSSGVVHKDETTVKSDSNGNVEKTESHKVK